MANRILSKEEIGAELARLDRVNPYLIGNCEISGMRGPLVQYTTADLLLPMAQFSERILQPLVHNVIARSIKPLLDRRGATHGDYRAMSTCIQQIKAVMRMGSKWIDMSEPQKEALELIATKIGRIIEGDPEYLDHWIDGAGYFTKGSEFCKKEPPSA